MNKKELKSLLLILIFALSSYINVLPSDYNVGSDQEFIEASASSDVEYLWHVTWPGNGLLNSLLLDSHENIIVAGAYSLVKYNSSGHLLWQHTIDEGYATASCIDTLDNIYIAGWRGAGIFLSKYNSEGVRLWYKTWNSPREDSCYDIALDSKNNIYLFGDVKTDGLNARYCLIKFNDQGLEIWNKTWRDPQPYYTEYAQSFCIDPFDNIYVAGSCSVYPHDFFVYLGKFNTSGSLQWELRYHPSVMFASKYDITCDYDGNIFITGGADSKIFLVKYNSSGDLQWDFLWISSPWDSINSITLDIRGNIYCGGKKSFSEIGFIMCNSSGNLQWNYTWGGISNMYFDEILVDSFNGIYLCGFSPSTTDAFLVKFKIFRLFNIMTPISYQLFEFESPTFSLELLEPSINRTWYTLNDGEKFFFSGETGKIDQESWDLCENGIISIKFYANDTDGNLDFEEVLVQKDTLAPNITIISPTHNQVFGNYSPSFELMIEEDNLDSIWYSLNNGDNYTASSNFGVINQNEWDLCENGTVIINFYANDTLGRVGSNDVIIQKDKFIPGIIINAPEANQICGPLSPFYNITIIGTDVHSRWYIINDTSIQEFTGTTGRINQETWNLFGEGNICIKFFANNSVGHYGVEEIWVLKRIYLTERYAYAIVVGISDYPGSDNDLNYCDDDAIGVYNMLINEYNFRQENIIYLQDSSATKGDIDNAFNTISSKVNPDDIFFFYYSGHGGYGTYNTQGNWNVETSHPYLNNYDWTWSVSHSGALYMRIHFERFQTEPNYDFLLCGGWEVTQGYYYDLLTGDLGYNFWTSYIPVSRYYTRFISDSSNPYPYYGFKIDKYEAILEDGTHYLCSYDSIPNNPSAYYMDALIDSKLDTLNCDNKYVFVDACHSGGLIPEVHDIGRYIMTACEDTESCLEDPTLEHGIFTYYLLESKNNATDQNEDGVISMEECYDYVYSNTVSYSGSVGGYTHHPQESDGINGQAVLYPSIGSVSINPMDNRLYYSFYLYGHGFLKTLNLSVCSISPTISFNTEEIKSPVISPTGFGYYSGFIELEEGYNASGIRLLAEIEGNTLIVIDLMIGDSDGDGLADFFEILQGGGLDPNSNDTDSDGLNDYDEFYGPTDPLNSDTDSDGLLDGEEVNIYGTDPVNSDTDSDGLTDYEEVITYNTNPLDADSDSDDLLDGDEINIHFTDPLNNDTDSDYLSDGDEVNIYTTNPLSNDTDSDGLTDYEEVIIYNTDPLQEDTDSDGLTDYEEVIIYNTDPLQEDTDSDGLTDYEEVVIYGTDPLNVDTDLDTMPDGWEVEHSLDPLVNDTALDPDNDLLTNLEEYHNKTHPQNPDTDDDGLLDGEEVKIYNTDPLQEDTDSDGLLDGEEVNIYGTDPLLSDTDSDGLSDGEEVNTYGTDPLSGDTDSDTMPDKWEVDNLLDPLVNDTALDPDNDLLINLLEYQHNTDPQNPDTDGDGWTDGDEVLVYDTDPLDPDSHPSKKTEAIPGYTIGLLIGIVSLIALILVKKTQKYYTHN